MLTFVPSDDRLLHDSWLSKWVVSDRQQPSATAQGTSSAAGVGDDKAEGSKNPTIRLVPFQSMPQSTQEELGKELFDDPLLSVENMKKLANSMQWCFKYSKVDLLLRLLAYVD